MPIVETGPYTSSYVIYDAPVNEKTKKLREMFKMDEETGYPEHYNFRNMARLGNSYKPEDPFLKFNPYDPDEDMATKVTYWVLPPVLLLPFQFLYNTYYRRPWWSMSHIIFPSCIGLSLAALWLHEKSLTRQAIRNSIIIDYTRKHPERFGETYRPKAREILFMHRPVR